MGQKIARKPERITGDKGVVRGRQLIELSAVWQVGMIRLEHCLTRGRHGRHIELVILRSHPSSREILLGSRSGGIRHLWNSLGDETWRHGAPGSTLSQRSRRKCQYSQESNDCFDDRI